MKELEQAAKEWFRSIECTTPEESFIAGANWQSEQATYAKEQILDLVRAKITEVYGGLSKDAQGHKLSIPYTVLGILHDAIPDNWQPLPKSPLNKGK